MEHISDMKNFIRSRQKKGKTANQIKEDLEKHGYDQYAAQGLVMIYFEVKDEDNV